MKIGIITGSIREGRTGGAVGEWVAEAAQKRGDAEFVSLDLKEFDVPLLTSATVPGAANKQYDVPGVQEWSKAVDACDGFVFVTPEYNHSIPGAFKNAYDSLGAEWMGKPVGFVSYGADNGVRAVEAWRVSIANFSQFGVRNTVSLGLFEDFGDDGFAPLDRRAGELDTMLDDLVEAVRSSKA